MEIVTKHKPPYGNTDNENRNVNAAIEETKVCEMSWCSYRDYYEYYDYDNYGYLIEIFILFKCQSHSGQSIMTICRFFLFLLSVNYYHFRER